MKNISRHIIFFMLFLLQGICYAATDSLPGCINSMKASTESFVTEYEYKGQRWFVFTKIVPPPEPNVSDKMYRTQFYDTGCKLVCVWTKGGIMGLNKVAPDTIEKAKIKKIGLLPQDTLIKQNPGLTALPDTIIKLALIKNSSGVKEYIYKYKKLYRLILPIGYKQQPEKGSVTIDDPYYDETGKIILIYKIAIQPMYTRAERWEPVSVKRSDVKEVPNGTWHRQKNNYLKLSFFP